MLDEDDEIQFQPSPTATGSLTVPGSPENGRTAVTVSEAALSLHQSSQTPSSSQLKPLFLSKKWTKLTLKLVFKMKLAKQLEIEYGAPNGADGERSWMENIMEEARRSRPQTDKVKHLVKPFNRAVSPEVGEEAAGCNHHRPSPSERRRSLKLEKKTRQGCNHHRPKLLERLERRRRQKLEIRRQSEGGDEIA